jgi:hypothetical protein
MEQDGTHGDGGGQKMEIKCSNLEKKKEKNKNGLRTKVYAIGLFLFCWSKTL